MEAFAADISNIVRAWRRDHFTSRIARPRYVRTAVAWLRDNRISAQLSDKDGVFVLVPAAVFAELKRVQVSKPCYRSISAMQIEVEHRHMIRSCHALASWLFRLGYKLWSGEIHRWANDCESRVSSALCGWRCAIKTHKGSGLVTARSIHSSVGHAFNALGETINRIVTPALRELEHLCWSSADVIRMVSQVRVGPRSIFLKFDIKEFYTSGEQDELAQRTSNLAPGPISAWVRECLVTLLSSQFVVGSVEDGTHLHVMSGSGMGMQSSGVVSNSAFFDRVEKPLLSPASRLKFGIAVYGRYQDDILVILEDLGMSRAFTAELIRLAHPSYRVERERFSLVGCSMLDLWISKRECSDGVVRLRWSPFIKDTARHVPLTSSSCHSWHCHRSWPRAEISRMHRLSWCRSVFETSKRWKIDRFSHFFLRRSVLQDCENWCPKIPLNFGFAPKISVDRRVLRIVLPYSSRWDGLRAELRKTYQAWCGSLSLLGYAVEVQVSFCRSSRPLWAWVCHIGL